MMQYEQPVAMTIAEASEHAGVSEWSIRNRIKKYGISVERAASMPNFCDPQPYRGKMMPLKDIAAKYGATTYELYRCMAETGKSAEDAAELIVDRAWSREQSRCTDQEEDPEEREAIARGIALQLCHKVFKGTKPFQVDFRTLDPGKTYTFQSGIYAYLIEVEGCKRASLIAYRRTTGAVSMVRHYLVDGRVVKEAGPVKKRGV